jgi:hypothetical protein
MGSARVTRHRVTGRQRREEDDSQRRSSISTAIIRGKIQVYADDDCIMKEQEASDFLLGLV